MTRRRLLLSGGLVGLGLSLALVILGCGVPARPGPGPLTSPLVVASPTPTAARLAIRSVAAVPLVATDSFTLTPLGGTFWVVSATLVNTGRAPLRPALGEWVLQDAAGQQFPRALAAEFILHAGGQPTWPDGAVPPGAAVTGLVVFDVAAWRNPVQLALYPEAGAEPLFSLPVSVAVEGP